MNDERILDRDPFDLQGASFWACPECRAELDAGTVYDERTTYTRNGSKLVRLDVEPLELVVWDDAAWPGTEQPWLFVECRRHGRVLVGVPFDARLIQLVKGAAA